MTSFWRYSNPREIGANINYLLLILLLYLFKVHAGYSAQRLLSGLWEGLLSHLFSYISGRLKRDVAFFVIFVFF